MWPVGVVSSMVCRGPGRGMAVQPGVSLVWLQASQSPAPLVLVVWSAVVPGDDVVQVADGGVAVGGAAGVVAGLDEAAEPGREDPGAGVHRDEVAGAGVGVEPAEPDGECRVGGASGCAAFVGSGGTRAGSCVVDEGAGPAGGDGAVAGEPGRLGVGLEEGAVGHDELDFDPGDPGRGAGAAFDQGVGHQLAAAPGVPGVPEGVGVPAQGGVDRPTPAATGSRAVR